MGRMELCSHTLISVHRPIVNLFHIHFIFVLILWKKNYKYQQLTLWKFGNLVKTRFDGITVDRKSEGWKKIGQIFKRQKKIMADSVIGPEKSGFFHLPMKFSAILFYAPINFSAIYFRPHFFDMRRIIWQKKEFGLYKHYDQFWNFCLYFLHFFNYKKFYFLKGESCINSWFLYICSKVNLGFYKIICLLSVRIWFV